ncbi:hypothetical protein QYE76_059054 [Lolium multiflorum]|uniref:F-box domain-containing protein n=1 Tax=Lolium multiflorum TaxID=4521 RepID=A0AAD8T7L2_LOLMU|nr:hypothetical protein QYE76_059054 [Lolium multiflorum]
MPSVDHISDLGDDLLLHVLRFLSDNARDVVCTSVLSTRWRHLWTRAPVLRILQHKPGSTYDDGDDARFNDFVHKVLARRACRGAGADIDRLDLYAWHWPGKSRADVWLRRAMRHTVGSLLFNVEGVSDWRPSRVELPTTTRVTKMWLELPTTTRVTKMWLELDGATLLLPPAVDFHKLTELTLGGIGFSDDDGPRLGHLLSSPSCCPTLRKLTLSGLSGLHHLRLHGGALETLDLSGLLNVRRLDVDAPRLALLHTDGFFMHYLHDDHTMPASPSGHPRWRDSKPPSRPAGSESNTTRSNCCTSAAPSMATRYAYLAPRYICLDHS